jgi:hypothetical protein
VTLRELWLYLGQRLILEGHNDGDDSNRRLPDAVDVVFGRSAHTASTRIHTQMRRHTHKQRHSRQPRQAGPCRLFNSHRDPPPLPHPEGATKP